MEFVAHSLLLHHYQQLETGNVNLKIGLISMPLCIMEVSTVEITSSNMKCIIRMHK